MNCEGKDMAGEENVHAQYVRRKRVAGVGSIKEPAQIRRKQVLFGR